MSIVLKAETAGLCFVRISGVFRDKDCRDNESI